MRCQNCDKELPDFPKEAVEDSSKDLEEVVSHSKLEKVGRGWTSTLTDYYCNPDCFMEAQKEEVSE